MSTTTITTEDLIQLESEELVESTLQEGVEVDIDDLLEDVISNPEDDRWKDERTRQRLYLDTPYYQQLQAKLRAAALLGAKIEAGEAIVCSRCGSIYEIGEWPLCGEGYGRDHGRVVSRNAQSNTVTAYYVNRRTGKIWIPGQNKHREPLDRNGNRIAGYERHEVRNFQERDKFYRLMDNEAKKKYYANLAKEQQTFDPIFAEGRKQARQDI